MCGFLLGEWFCLNGLGSTMGYFHHPLRLTIIWENMVFGTCSFAFYAKFKEGLVSAPCSFVGVGPSAVSR